MNSYLVRYQYSFEDSKKKLFREYIVVAERADIAEVVGLENILNDETIPDRTLSNRWEVVGVDLLENCCECGGYRKKWAPKGAGSACP